jgi:hypothetical protein
MTILSTAITIDGDTATLVVDDCESMPDRQCSMMPDNPCDVAAKDLDRLCDTCNGSGSFPAIQSQTDPCPDCDGTGRHCFTLDVESEPFWSVDEQAKYHIEPCDDADCCKPPPKQLSVHVVEVLPIVAWDTVDLGLPHPVPCMTIDPHGNALEVDEAGVDCFKAHDRTLPPDAADDMFCVRLAVHT